MNDDVFEVLLCLLLVSGMIVIGDALMVGIRKLAGKIQTVSDIRRRRETIAAVKLYRETARRVPGELVPAEYTRAVRYTIRKYRLAARGGTPDLRRQDVGYIADLVVEAVGQGRLSRDTMEIARNARELEQSENQERNETA